MLTKLHTHRITIIKKKRGEKKKIMYKTELDEIL